MANINTEVSKEDLKSAKGMWHNFTVLLKWSTIAVIAVLLLMLLFIY